MIAAIIKLFKKLFSDDSNVLDFTAERKLFEFELELKKRMKLKKEEEVVNE